MEDKKDKKEKMQLKCGVCNYETTTKWNMKLHKLAQHSTIEEKNSQKYYCSICNIVLQCDKYYKKHIDSNKHKMMVFSEINSPKQLPPVEDLEDLEDST